MNHNKIMCATQIALGAAIMCLLAPLSFPIGPVPVSIASFAVYLISAVTGRKNGSVSILLYLLMGAVGVPVFAGWTAGVARLAGPTGGFLIGYFPCAYLTGLFADKLFDRKWALPAGMLTGTVILYVMGLVWFMISTGNSFVRSFAACILYFLPGDAVKIVFACAVSVPVRAAINRMLYAGEKSGTDH